MTVFAAPSEGEAENFDSGHESIVWVTPGLCKATMGANAACSNCGAKHQLRILMVEEMQLPMGFIAVEDETCDN
jgi:hypothetical protein